MIDEIKQLRVPDKPSPKLAELLIQNTPEEIYNYYTKILDQMTHAHILATEPMARIVRELIYGREC